MVGLLNKKRDQLLMRVVSTKLH